MLFLKKINNTIVNDFFLIFEKKDVFLIKRQFPFFVFYTVFSFLFKNEKVIHASILLISVSLLIEAYVLGRFYFFKTIAFLALPAFFYSQFSGFYYFAILLFSFRVFSKMENGRWVLLRLFFVFFDIIIRGEFFWIVNLGITLSFFFEAIGIPRFLFKKHD